MSRAVVEPAAAAIEQLRRVTIVAVADIVLLLPLVIGVVSDSHGLAPIIGPLHGAVFLYGVFLAAMARPKAGGAGGIQLSSPSPAGRSVRSSVTAGPSGGPGSVTATL